MTAKRGRSTKRGAHTKMAAAKTAALALPLPDNTPPPMEKDVSGAIGVLLKTWHADTEGGEWLLIARTVTDQVRCDF